MYYCVFAKPEVETSKKKKKKVELLKKYTFHTRRLHTMLKYGVQCERLVLVMNCVSSKDRNFDDFIGSGS